MAPLDGGNFQGIDPSMLAQLIKSMTSGVTGAQPVASTYMGQFNRLGLDTSAVQKLLADYAWASGQQPMLQRRYSLASHQPSGDFLDGWTSEGAGSLAFATTGAAKQAGTTDAKQMQAYLDDHDWSGIQKMLTAMAQNGGDADYMAAFFSQLGPTGLYGLSLYAQGGSSKDKDNEQEVKEIVGSGLATASFEMPLSMKFLQGIEPENPPLGYVTEEMPGGWDTGALAPFLTEGQFSDQWLKTISPTVLYQKGAVEEPGGPGVPPGYDAIFTAISNSPDFAAQFYQQNSGQLNDYMTEPLLYHYLANGQGFGKFLEAATIPPQGETNTKPFTTNATEFVKLFGGGNVDTSSSVRQAMAADTANYFNDVVGTVTAAAPGAGSTMGLTASEWGSFVQNAMRDKTSAAYLLTYYGNWRASQPVDNLAVRNGVPIPGDGPDTPTHAGYWHDTSTGLLDYFFASNYQAAGSTAGNGDGGVKDILVGAFSAGSATLLTSVMFGPEAGAMELIGEAGKDAFSSAAEDSIKTITTKLADGGDGGDGPAPLDASLTSMQQQWSDGVTTMWQQSGSTPGHPSFLPKATYPQGYVEYNGVKYNGDPLPYEQQYGGSFMNSDGSIKSTDDIAKDPKSLAAYNAWLQDPAISAQQGPLFATQSGGALMSMYDHLLGGGGGGG
jgi:hypothetical protein